MQFTGKSRGDTGGMHAAEPTLVAYNPDANDQVFAFDATPQRRPWPRFSSRLVPSSTMYWIAERWRQISPFASEEVAHLNSDIEAPAADSAVPKLDAIAEVPRSRRLVPAFEPRLWRKFPLY